MRVTLSQASCFTPIIDKGGEVRYKKEKGSNNVEVLWIQTQDMRKQLALTKPHLFECDTTFGTRNTE